MFDKVQRRYCPIQDTTTVFDQSKNGAGHGVLTYPFSLFKWGTLGHLASLAALMPFQLPSGYESQMMKFSCGI